MPTPAPGQAAPPARALPGQYAGALIGSAFGVVYVAVNAWPFPAPVAWAARAAAIAVCAATVVAVGLRARPWERRAGSPAPPAHVAAPAYSVGGPGLARGFWLIVAAEAAALFGGLAVLNAVLHAPHAGVAWVSVVVGVHFFALGRLFQAAFFHLLGGIIAACGVLGLVFAALDTTGAATAAVAGVVPGAALLGFGLWGAIRRGSPG